MTIFGKVLIVFNLLVAGAFAYFATQDWRGRQTITAAGVRHALVVKGLPLGPADAPADLPSDAEAEIPFVFETAGGFRTETVSKKLLETYFQPLTGGTLLGGPPVSSQLGEVKRVKAKLDATLAEAGEDAEKKVKLLTGWLLTQAETLEERQALQKLIAAGDADGLKARLDARFAAVINPPAAPDMAFAAEPLPKLADLHADLQKAKADKVDVEAKQKAYDEAAAGVRGRIDRIDETRGAPLEAGDRLARIAHLLTHLDPDVEWQKRVSGVVGMRQFVRTITAQTERFRRMTEQVDAVLSPEQATYLAEERRLLRRAIHDTDVANRQAEERLKQVEQEKRDADFVGQRGTQLKAIKDRLTKLKAEVDELLVRQSGIESALFEVQREVAVTLDEVYRLEAVLEARERELLRLANAGGN